MLVAPLGHRQSEFWLFLAHLVDPRVFLSNALSLPIEVRVNPHCHTSTDRPIDRHYSLFLVPKILDQETQCLANNYLVGCNVGSWSLSLTSTTGGDRWHISLLFFLNRSRSPYSDAKILQFLEHE
jgi:hypothetical protein